MNYNPNEDRQDKITSKLIIEHALECTKSQQSLALELGLPESRISDAKKGNYRLATEAAKHIVSSYGLPTNAIGEYTENCISLGKSEMIGRFLKSKNDLQLSIVIEQLLIKIKMSISPERHSQSEITPEDIKINDLLQDKEFIEIGTKLATELLLYDEFSSKCVLNLDRLKTDTGATSLVHILERYQLDHFVKSKNKAVETLLFVAYAIKVCNQNQDCLRLQWVNFCGQFKSNEQKTHLVITGKNIASENWFDRKLAVFNRTSKKDDTWNNDVLNIALQLDKMAGSSLNYEYGPLLSGDFSPLSILITKINVYYKENESTFTVALGVDFSTRILEPFKLEPFNLIIDKITPGEMLNNIVPQLSNLPVDSCLLDFAISDVSIKQFFAHNGIMIPGTIVI